MIRFERFVLDNGLRVLIHQDTSTPLAAVNVLYDAGSRVEHPDRTGMAHLFEHLMFSGTRQVPDFDEAIQMAGGDANAFTNADITNFYEMMPAANLETALWLEADRMQGLTLKKRKIQVQKKVVIEEFKESCLDQPYGNVWHLLAALAYTVHPYRWPTIGLTPEHIIGVNQDDLLAHYHAWYQPANAVLSIASPHPPALVKDWVKRWFEPIPGVACPVRSSPIEPPQTYRREITEHQQAPLDALYMGFVCPGRTEPAYFPADLLTDALANGPSSRLYRRFIMEQERFSHIDCYQTGNIEPGLLIIEGKPLPGVTLEEAEALIWDELHKLIQEGIPERELTKLKNKNEASIAYSQVSVIHKAINLAYFEWMGHADGINQELDQYRSVTREEMQLTAACLFAPEKANVVQYRTTPSTS
jgi:zinc protease